MKSIKTLFLSFIVLIMCFNHAHGQYSNIYKQDSLIKVLVKRHVALSQARKTMPGYRVQVFFGPERNEALEVKSEFNKMYEDLPAYLTYQQPNFKIRVGNFKTRLEALKYLKDIQLLYTGAFLVKDNVKLPGL